MIHKKTHLNRIIPDVIIPFYSTSHKYPTIILYLMMQNSLFLPSDRIYPELKKSVYLRTRSFFRPFARIMKPSPLLQKGSRNMTLKAAAGRITLCLLLLWLRILLTSSASAPALSFDKMPPPRGADFSPAVMTAALSPPLRAACMTDPFGWRFHPLTGQLDFHYGLDLAADEKTPIYAALSGTVRSASQGDSYGNYVILDHQNGFATLYAHCSKLLVQEGETVRKGQKIALVGSTGAATGPHLHFEMIQDGIRLDPLWALGDGERVTAIPEPEESS